MNQILLTICGSTSADLLRTLTAGPSINIPVCSFVEIRHHDFLPDVTFVGVFSQALRLRFTIAFYHKIIYMYVSHCSASVLRNNAPLTEFITQHDFLSRSRRLSAIKPLFSTGGDHMLPQPLCNCIPPHTVVEVVVLSFNWTRCSKLENARWGMSAISW